MFNAFISYRRDNGFYLARLVRDQLESRGISAFLDLEELRSGEFNIKLREAIKDSDNFILILPKGALDRCIEQDDWVRREIMIAKEFNKNIIPVLGDNFKWPRDLYPQFPEELQKLEFLSGVVTSKDYMDAMIDRLISFMYNVESSISSKQQSISNGFVNTSEYFANAIKDGGNIDRVDMAFHAGAEWFTDIEKTDLLYDLIDIGTNIRVILNAPDVSEMIASHMRHTRKRYIKFEECIKNWKKFETENQGQVEVRISNIPILRRYYSLHMKDKSTDTINVKYYTYANAKTDKNYQPIFYADSEYFKLYRDEFSYLWSKSENNAVPFLNNQNPKENIESFFHNGLNNIQDSGCVDMFFRAGSEWHYKTGMLDILSNLIQRRIKVRVMVNKEETVKDLAFHMRQPLKKYYGYNKSLMDWLEKAKAYPDLICVKVADIPLMHRYYCIRDNQTGINRISYYTYGNYDPNKDFFCEFNSSEDEYILYQKEFSYIWDNASKEVDLHSVELSLMDNFEKQGV